MEPSPENQPSISEDPIVEGPIISSPPEAGQEPSNEASSESPTDILLENVPQAATMPADPTVQSTDSVPSTATPVVSKHKSSKKVIVLIVLTTVLVLCAAGGWAVYGMHLFDKKTVNSSTSDTNTTDVATDTNNDITDPILKKFVLPTTGEVWSETPKTLSGQGYLTTELASSYTAYPGSTIEEQMKQNAPTYEEIGTHAGKTIILVTLAPAMENPADSFLFEKGTDGKVAVILKPQARATITDETLKNMKDFLTSKVTTYDTTTHYDSLNIPATLSIGSETVGITAEALSIGKADSASQSDSVKYTDVATFGKSRLSRVETAFSDTKLTNIGYRLVLPIGTAVSLTYTPNGSTLEGYTFTNGASTQVKDYQGNLIYDPIIAIARGCSLSTAQVTRSDSLKLTDLTAVGKTASGRTVYAPTDTTSGLYKKAYDEYKEMIGASAASFETYQKDHGLLLIQNANKELLVYVRESYAAIGGCAKPVVYLYPTKAEQVSVKVGANVTVSDPAYPTNGWQGVWAEPNGKLTYLGKTYDSLFWEGQGNGEYPGITTGTVVKRADAAKTIRTQLAAQGLNAKETSDFMAFWEAKIPNKPYVRLTWLGTSQMNALAPLTVSPKPQTVIRVFLDMDGFDTAIKLPAQKLTKVERKGFTVVEWGGLTPLVRH